MENIVHIVEFLKIVKKSRLCTAGYTKKGVEIRLTSFLLFNIIIKRLLRMYVRG